MGPRQATRRFSLMRATPPLDRRQSMAVLEKGLFQRFWPWVPKIWGSLVSTQPRAETLVTYTPGMAPRIMEVEWVG